VEGEEEEVHEARMPAEVIWQLDTGKKIIDFPSKTGLPFYTPLPIHDSSLDGKTIGEALGEILGAGYTEGLE
jgi:hypothetical protein